MQFDEIPVKSHAAIPPDLVPKSPKSSERELSPQSSIVIKRQQSTNRRKDSIELKPDFSLTKTDSLAAFLKFEDDLECSPLKDKNLSEKELKDKSNNLNKKSLFELNDNKFNDLNEFDMDRLPTTNTKNSVARAKLMPIKKSIVRNKIIQLEANPTELLDINYSDTQTEEDYNDNFIDSNLINSCDNLKISNVSKLPNQSSSFDEANHFLNHDTTIEKNMVTDGNTNTINFNKSTAHDSSGSEDQKFIELILRNINDSDKRNPKRQLQLHKDNLLFDNELTVESNENDRIKSMQDTNITEVPLSRKYSSNVSDANKLSRTDVQNIESLFDDFDLEEFISSFNDNEQFPIFKNYKETVSSNRVCGRRQNGSSSEESEFEDRLDQNEIDVSEKDRTLSIESSIDRDNCDSFDIPEPNQKGIEGKSLERPDVTVEAEQRESELNKLDTKNYTTDTKLNQLDEILDESGEISEAERELLNSVQELKSMCEVSQTPDLTSDVFLSKTDDPIETPLRRYIFSSGNLSSAVEMHVIFLLFFSLFVQSSADRSTGDFLKHNQRNRHQSILSFQMPEIVGLSSNSNCDLGRMSLKTIIPKNELSKLNGKGPKLNANGFDRVLPPITVHKNDSQNIYNTINMTLNQSNTNDSAMKSTMDRKSSLSNLGALKLSKFCHECGAKFIVDQAKFCMECGVKRANLD